MKIKIFKREIETANYIYTKNNMLSIKVLRIGILFFNCWKKNVQAIEYKNRFYYGVYILGIRIIIFIYGKSKK
jgi:hypothetical protein